MATTAVPTTVPPTTLAPPLLEESFEGTGYENAWNEGVDAGCTLDEDSSIPGTPPTGAGSQCLKAITVDEVDCNARATHVFGSSEIVYAHAYIYIDEAIIAEGEVFRSLATTNVGGSVCVQLFFGKDGSGNITCKLYYHSNGSGQNSDTFIIPLDAWIRYEYKYDKTNLAWEFRINGVTKDSGSLISPITPYRAEIGIKSSTGYGSVTLYTDLVVFDDDWVGLSATTAAPTTVPPTTLAPTTLASTTLTPTTLASTTLAPTTLNSTTLEPTTLAPTTIAPTTIAATTLAPTSLAPTTLSPTTLASTTLNATTLAPTTTIPTTLSPTTLASTTLSPTTLASTTLAPTTLVSTTLSPTTLAPTTLASTTASPTTTSTPATTPIPTTLSYTTIPPTTIAAATTTTPTTLSPTNAPTTVTPTTLTPTTLNSSTLAPTTNASSTVSPTTLLPTTLTPTTLLGTTVAPTTLNTTTLLPTTLAPTTLGPTTLAPTTTPSTTLVPTTTLTTTAPTTPPPHNADLDTLFNCKGNNFAGYLFVDTSITGVLLNASYGLADLELYVETSITGEVPCAGLYTLKDLELFVDTLIKGWGVANDNKKNWVGWSKIGEANFAIDLTNDAGFRPMDWPGYIYQVIKLDKYVIIYGSGGITAAYPVMEPMPTFGFKNMLSTGIKNKTAVTGDEHIHFCIDILGCLYRISSDGITRLGYEEFLLPLINPVLTWDVAKRRLYISDETVGYIYSESTLTGGYANLTGLYRVREILTAVSPDTLITEPVEICTDIIDFKRRGLKSIESMQFDAISELSLFASIDYRYRKQDEFKTTQWSQLNAEGVAHIRTAGVEFRIRLKGLDHGTFDLSYISIQFKFIDQRFTRDPKGELDVY